MPVTNLLESTVAGSAPVEANKCARVKQASDVIGTKMITLSGTTVTVSGISTTSVFSGSVQATAPIFIWEIYDGTNWVSLGNSGPHKILSSLHVAQILLAG
jgi:hypothetical protein